MSKHRDNELEYITRAINLNPDLHGWMVDDEGDEYEDWYFVKQDHTFPADTIMIANDVKCAFNFAGRAIDGFVRIYEYPEIHDKNKRFVFNDYYDPETLTFEECMNLGDNIYYYQGHNGVASNKIVNVKLSDGEYLVATDVMGKLVQSLIHDGKLCMHGFLADSRMFTTPYEKFGTVMFENVPFLISNDGKVLNIEKSRYKDGKIFAYVNSDKTFFYSSNLRDPKWY